MHEAIAKSTLSPRDKLRLRLLIVGCRRKEAEDLVITTLGEEGLLPLGFAGVDSAIDPDTLDRILQFLVEWLPTLIELLSGLK
jgi:hypothetical protein